MTLSLKRVPANTGEEPAVGYVVKMFPRLSETFILNEILELERQGLNLRIFSLKRPADTVRHAQAEQVRSPIFYLPEGIHRAPLRIARAHLQVWLKSRRAWRHAFRNALRRARSEGDASSLTAFCQACCIIREMGSARHLHAHYANVPAKIALLVHRLSGIPYSITTHAKDIFQNDPFASPKLHERMCRARFVVANSRFSANHIRAELNGEAEVQVVHNGLDLDEFPFRSCSAGEPIILSVGRLVEKKGFADLIAACHILRLRGIRFSCQIVGTGRLSSNLKDQIRARGLADCVRLVGPLAQQALRGYYERAMVFALACVPAGDGDRDILPNAVKEALAVGVPVVTTRLEGIEELIEAGVSGLLVEPRNPAALAAKFELLLRDAQLRARLAVEGRKVIEARFDRCKNFAELKALLLESKPEPALDSMPPIETLQPL